MSWLETFITTIFGSVAISGAIIHFGKGWITKRLDYQYAAKLEVHKAKMKSVSDTALEKLKSSLTVESNKHSVVFNNLHERRAEILAKTYQLLVTTRNNLEAYTSPVEFVGAETKESRRQEFGRSLEEFTEYYSSHAIYLTESIVIELKIVDAKMTTVGQDFMAKVEMASTLDPKGWKQIYAEVELLTETTMKKIEEEFRTILSGKNI
ncbi:hypothetical protein [Shewanella polaris]|uniref:Uncharacterized protein n=1 Tax=Shewanella polaris TaxID=2588449 RepID=A0A4Y5YIN3_9GAMM|nr:hypothetical protein [Shewanella polaris]QDE32396.1 hypothetical protein FH971_16350 [Shewanella polaris]